MDGFPISISGECLIGHPRQRLCLVGCGVHDLRVYYRTLDARCTTVATTRTRLDCYAALCLCERQQAPCLGRIIPGSHLCTVPAHSRVRGPRGGHTSRPSDLSSHLPGSGHDLLIDPGEGGYRIRRLDPSHTHVPRVKLRATRTAMVGRGLAGLTGLESAVLVDGRVASG